MNRSQSTTGRRPGRPTKGLAHIEGLAGSRFAKERLRVLLETLSGETSITDAMTELEISRTRIVQLRAQVLGAALAELEPKTPGRVKRVDSGAEQRTKTLQSEIDLLRWEIQAAHVREEVALLLPHRAAEPATRSERRDTKMNRRVS